MGKPDRTAATSGAVRRLSAPDVIPATDGPPSAVTTVVETQLTAIDERRIAETLCALLADMEIETDRAHGPTLVSSGPTS